MSPSFHDLYRADGALAWIALESLHDSGDDKILASSFPEYAQRILGESSKSAASAKKTFSNLRCNSGDGNYLDLKEIQ